MTDQPIDNRVSGVQQAESNSDFKRAGLFQHVMNAALGWISAFLCLVCLVILSIAIAGILLGLVALIADAVPASAGMGWPGAYSAIFYVLVGLMCGLIFFIIGMVIGRFLLRAIPPRLSGKRRIGVIAVLGFLNLFFVAGTIEIAVKGAAATPSATMMDGSFIYTIAMSISFVFGWLGFTFPLGARHLNPRRFLRGPYVLFLRRFSMFPDRTIQNTLLKTAPAGKPVTFLTPTRSRAGDWNPFRIGFSGLKLRRPVRSMPVILRSTNEDWRRAAKELINRAQTIVLDITGGSGAIQSEIDMIDAAGRWQDVVVLSNEWRPDTDEAEQMAQFTDKRAIIIAYKKSWARAIPRLFLGLFATFSVIFFLFIILPMMATMGTVPGDASVLTGSGEMTALRSAVLDIRSSAYKSIGVLLLYGWIYFNFFVRPSLNKGAEKALSKRLRAGGRNTAFEQEHVVV